MLFHRKEKRVPSPRPLGPYYPCNVTQPIVAPVAAGLTELDGLVPGPLAAEDAKYREAARAGRARTAAAARPRSRARGPEPQGFPGRGRSPPGGDRGRTSPSRPSRGRAGAGAVAIRRRMVVGTRSEITTRLRRRLITRFTSVTTSERFTEFTKRIWFRYGSAARMRAAWCAGRRCGVPPRAAIAVSYRLRRACVLCTGCTQPCVPLSLGPSVPPRCTHAPKRLLFRVTARWVSI